MPQHVDWFGHPILWHIVVGLVVYRHVCPCVRNASRKAITIATTLICFLAKLVVRVTVVIRPL